MYCYDPRCAGVPAAVAAELGEVYPGEIVTDAEGNKVGSTTTLFEVVVAGGRAIDARRSITTAQHLFGIENVVIVHHTRCGAALFTADEIIESFRREHGADIAGLYERDSISISDYETSLKHDARLMRESAGTPKHVDIYGYLFDIDTGELSLAVHDKGVASRGR